MVNKLLSNGTLHITEEVLAIITLVCISECEGIENISTGIKDGFISKLNRSYAKKGISISHDDQDYITIEVKVAIQTGFHIVDTCKKLQKTIASDIEALSGISVHQVNISVVSVILD